MSLKVQSFFVGGEDRFVGDLPIELRQFTNTVPETEFDPNGTHSINSAYVQAFKPDVSHHYPVILQHGGGMSGSMWETTPDGRDGWLNMFIGANYRTYVIDNVGRGRAGWPAIDLNKLGSIVLRTQEEAWSLFRFGHPDNFNERVAIEGQRFPVSHLSRFSSCFVPRWLAHQEESEAALVNLLETTGPSVLVAHSQGAQAAFDTCKAKPGLVAGLVLIEPSALPDQIEWFVEAEIPCLLVRGDNLHISKLWRDLAESYTNFDTEIKAAGGRVDILDVSSEISPGFTHMMMMDHGNELVFNSVEKWIASTIENKKIQKKSIPIGENHGSIQF